MLQIDDSKKSRPGICRHSTPEENSDALYFRLDGPSFTS